MVMAREKASHHSGVQCVSVEARASATRHSAEMASLREAARARVNHRDVGQAFSSAALATMMECVIHHCALVARVLAAGRMNASRALDGLS